MNPKPGLLLVGPTPPPYHGMTTVTEMLLGSKILNDAFDVVHLDNADRRSQENMGRLDLHNVRLGVIHAIRLFRLLLRHRPELMLLPISQNRWAYVRDAVFMAIAALTGTRVFVHLHGGGFRQFYEESGPVMRWLIRRSLAGAAGAGVLASSLRSLYDGLVPPERVHVIPNGIADPFPDGVERCDADVPTVTYLGTLVRSKGFMDVIRAADRLRDRGVRAGFVCAGPWNSEEEEAEARELVASRDLRGVVSFPGVVTGEEKEELLRRSDIFTLPSRYPPEGQPLVILEAMAAALPVVSTSRGAIPDMVEDGRTGMLIEEGDEEALASALADLIRSEERRLRMGENGRTRFLERFTETRSVEALVDALRSVTPRAA